MKAQQYRNWIGLYLLISTTAIGTYILIFGSTRLLPISKSDSDSAFQIIMPVLLGQLAFVFRWFSLEKEKKENLKLSLPVWVVKAPPILTGCVMAAGIIAAIISGNSNGKTDFFDGA